MSNAKKKLMHCHCGTNNRAPRSTFADPANRGETRCPGGQNMIATHHWLLFTIYNHLNILFFECGNLSMTLHALKVREKGRDLTQSYDKSPYTNRRIQNATLQHKNDTKNFNYTTIADRLRMVIWGNNSDPTDVVKSIYGILTFPLTATPVKSKGHTFKNL